MTDLSRRRLLTGTGLAMGAGAAAGAGLVQLGKPESASAAASGGSIPFHGVHQAGIATPIQERLHFASFDLGTRSPAEAAELMKSWTAAAVRMTAAEEIGRGATGRALAPPDDTGETLEMHASRLTLTVGFGPSFFTRLNLPAPDRLKELPAFRGDRLDPARSGGDVCVQACADDPQVAVHAVRNLTRIAAGKASLRWSQIGFGRTASTTPEEKTPRNLMGFKDGTNNISMDDRSKLNRHVWVGEEGPGWMEGGSYLVTRRIRMHLDIWDRTPLKQQEDVIGRYKRTGAPYGGTREFDPVRIHALPPASHVRLAHPDSNGGSRILRRGYSYTDGTDGQGRLDAGLFFIAYQRDPEEGFVKLQRSLSARDTLNAFIQHVGSGVWACPGGVRPGSFWGEALFS
ncbi:iron uptake transporter deferrochelatase/peroxidase subunit [Planomonospora parontospora]|uniref:iron uptake transporter deferrochelatase/peroxidase subunit n=1 Tax=Planomonospora parontospora TaxID=58119 RepID=UPI0016711CAC|nr:iron uptake transporter deferrochelatase/peroxidase subunit [Planomonospora parontospora]GGL02447.1 peroxidase [Planomonospora parontospora subsp. antibiotica]GII16745.1 peroxidase [Planomonospora parontospora subsp. antibiotica]